MSLPQGVLQPQRSLWDHARREDSHYVTAQFLVGCCPRYELFPGSLIESDRVKFVPGNAPPAWQDSIGYQARRRLVTPPQTLVELARVLPCQERYLQKNHGSEQTADYGAKSARLAARNTRSSAPPEYL